MSVADSHAVPQYSPHENTPRVGSAEGAGMEPIDSGGQPGSNRISLFLFSHKAPGVVNRRLVT